MPAPYIKDNWSYTPPETDMVPLLRHCHARHAKALRSAAFHRSWATPGSLYYTPANARDGVWYARRDLKDAAAWRAEIARRARDARMEAM